MSAGASNGLRLLIGFTLSFGPAQSVLFKTDSVETILFSFLMLRYAIIFLIIALIAEAFGAGGVAGEASWIAHVLLVIAVIFMIISFVAGRRGPPAI